MADKKTLELQIKVLAEEAARAVKGLSADFKGLASQVKGMDSSGIAATVKNLQGELTRTANSMKLFGASASEVKAAQSRIKAAALDLIDGGLKPESKEIQELVSQYRRLEAASGDLEGASGGLSGGFADILDNVRALAPAVAAISFDKQLGAAAGFALNQSDNFRAMREDFGIMLGDMEAGRGLFNELQEFNFWTPFDMEQTAQATKVLLSAKVPLADITEYLTRFGDISQGNGQKFQSFINAFSKGAAKGKVDMEVLNVYLDQGIGILDEMGRQFGVTTGDVVKMASEGRISFQQFDEALRSLAAEGGLYYGSMETASQRLEAAQAGLEESVNALAASLGDMLAPAASAVVSGITNLVDAINASPFLKGALVGVITAIAVAINVKMVAALVSFAAKTWASFAAQMALNTAVGAMNPVVMAATVAVGAAVAGYVAFAASQQNAADAAADANLELRKQAEHFDQLKQSAKEYMQFMREMTIDEALATVNSYQSIVIPAAEQALREAQAKLAATPAMITEQVLVGTDSFSGESWYETRERANPDYAAAQANVQAAQAELEVYQERLKEARNMAKEIEAAKFSADLAEANKLLERRDQLYKSTDEARREQILADLDFARSLLTLQTLNADGTTSGFDPEKTRAIIKRLEKELDDFDGKGAAGKAAQEVGEEWSRKIMSEADRLRAEFSESQKKLAEVAKNYYGDTYAAQADYIRENAALEQYYRDKITEAERRAVIELHGKQMSALREEAEYMKEAARQRAYSGDASAVGQFAAGEALSAVADTEAGQLVKGFALGGIIGLILEIIGAVVKLFANIESINKLLNIFTTVLTPVIEAIEPMVNSGLRPLVNILEELGRTIGMVLAPAFNVLSAVTAPVNAALNALKPVLVAVQKVFEWLNNNVIVPVGNAFIDIINGVIGLLNNIPFVDIDKIERLQVIGEKAEEIAEEMEKHADLMSKKLDRQKEAVNDMLQAQLDALQSQYELGLISRDEYEAQAEKYASAADEKLYEINKQQADILAQIEDNTYQVLSDSAKSAVAESRGAYAEKWGDVVPVLGHVAGAIADVGTAVWNGLKSVGKTIAGWFGFDVGTISVPYDMPAMVHKGETIIPRTFAEGIRSGELSLVGGKGGGGGSHPVCVTVNVGGSVLSERELVDAVYDGIARGIRSGAKNPLPGAA